MEMGLLGKKVFYIFVVVLVIIRDSIYYRLVVLRFEMIQATSVTVKMMRRLICLEDLLYLEACLFKGEVIRGLDIRVRHHVIVILW